MTDRREPTVPEGAAPVDTDRRSPSDTPGPLRGEVWLTLQTRQAQRLFSGRKATPERPYIIGLTRFGTLLSQMQVCVYADDPYADWWLLKVEAALKRAAHEVKTLRLAVQDRLKHTPSMEIAIAASLEPIRVPLQFRNPYAYEAGRVLADFDILVRGVLTARHVGLMDRREGMRAIVLGARAMRRAMGTAYGYKYEGVKRTDIVAGNAKSERARARMGEVPPEVLAGTRRARFAPERRPLKPATVAEAFTRPRSFLARFGASKTATPKERNGEER